MAARMLRFSLPFVAASLGTAAIGSYTQTSVGTADYFALNASTPGFTALGVQGYQQTTGYTCGPSSVMSLLRFYGTLQPNQMNRDTELKIANAMGTNPDVGTTDTQIVNWLNNNGYDATSYVNGTIDTIKKHMKEGTPLIMCWIDWGGHWVVSSAYYAVGAQYTEGKDTLFLADPAAHFQNVNNTMGITGFNSDRFQDMWFNLNGGAYTQVGLYIVAKPKAATTEKM